MNLELITYPHPTLKKVAELVPEVGEEQQAIFMEMMRIMHESQGIGLAANQVDTLQRLIVVTRDTNKNDVMDPENMFFMANPEITYASNETKVYNEGCLSLPGITAEIVRADKIRVQYLDYNNQSQILDADGVTSVCIQHEIDHLNGITFVDHLSDLKRKFLLQKMKKIQKKAQG